MKIRVGDRSRIVTDDEARRAGYCPTHLWDLPCPDCELAEKLAEIRRLEREAHRDAGRRIEDGP